MKLSSALVVVCAALPASLAFIGHGISMYKPSCAFACRGAIASAPLKCTKHSAHSAPYGPYAGGTSPKCRAGDKPFLTSLAWCLNATCAEPDVDTWELEWYWRYKATGDADVLPEWTYSEALQHIIKPPDRRLKAKETLNSTVKVAHDKWLAQKKTLEYFEEQETLHARYGLVLLITGFATPIVFTLFGHIRFTSGILDKIKPYLVYPSLIGTYQVRPLPYLLGNAPTLGQSLYIALFAVLNIVLMAVNYRSTQPNTRFANTYQEIMTYVSNRAGVLAFALAPLVILFAGRNNILLWLTDWSHSTYMILHRWVARIFAVQVIVHSIIELVRVVDSGEYGEKLVMRYWIWGMVATLVTCLFLVTSMLPVRRWSYEVFLITHILLAVFLIAGCWYHVEYRFQREWGYEFWLYAACAVWVADRLIRMLRIAKAGLNRATVVAISEHIVRVDVPGVRWPITPGAGGYHAFVFFPTLHRLRPWENHPFAVIPTALLQQPPPTSTTSPLSITTTTSSSSPSTLPSPTAVGITSASSSNYSRHTTETTRTTPTDPEKHAGLPSTTTTATSAPTPQKTIPGISFYIKKSTGLTTLLFPPSPPRPSLPTLLDGPYRSATPARLLHGHLDRLVLIGGGIGITGLLGYLPSPANRGPAVSLYWSVKAADEGLVRELEGVLGHVAERVVCVGGRVDVEGVVGRVRAEEEGEGEGRRVGVVVCGPGGLCDRVRGAVVEVGRMGGEGARTAWVLEVCAFSW